MRNILVLSIIVALLLGCGDPTSRQNDSAPAEISAHTQYSATDTVTRNPYFRRVNREQLALADSDNPVHERRLARADINPDTEKFQPGPSRYQSDPPLPAGKIVTLKHDGRERSYLIYVPSNYGSEKSIPLVLVFHGGGGNAYGIARKTQMNSLAEQHKFIVVYPNGTGEQARPRFTWNAGSYPPKGYAETQNIDDIGFVRAILQQLKKEYAIDPKRIYATGLSKGAMFSYRLACEMSDQFAAIAPVAGFLKYEQCRPNRPVPVLHIHGDSDQVVSFVGQKGDSLFPRNINDLSPAQIPNPWWQRNNCDPVPTRTEITPDTTRFSYKRCDNDINVIYYVVHGSGHGWPSGNYLQSRKNIYISNQLYASDEIWKFFAANPRP